MSGDILEPAARLAGALAAGLLVGLERGWQGRKLPDGGRVAGLRTFALIGLLGGVLGLDAGSLLPAAAALAGVALLFAVSFRGEASARGSLSITTAVAGLLTFALGLLAARGQVLLAVGAAAVTALLLRLKQELHRGISRIAPEELTAVLQLGVLTAAILPLLPDRGMGPYGAWNPFRLWLAVIVVASLSLAGQIAWHWRGARQGMLWTGLLGGLASSTAATLALARAAREAPDLSRPAAAGAVAASGMMFLRMAVVVGLLQPRLLPAAGTTLVWLAAVAFAVAAWQWRAAPAASGPAAPASMQPVFDLPIALGFAAFLALVALAAQAAQDGLGSAGLYGVAFVSGLADVDAVLISTLQMAPQPQVPVALTVITLTVVANMLVKAVMAALLGGRAFAWRVAGAYCVVALAAAVGAGIAHAAGGEVLLVR